jgi:hypothetical protein
MTTQTKNKWRGIAIEVLLFIVVVAGIRLWQQRDMVSGVAPVLQILCSEASFLSVILHINFHTGIT